MTDDDSARSQSVPARSSRPWVPALELALLVALTAADAQGLVPLSRTPFLLLICWLSLRLRDLRWRAIGFAWPARKGRAVLVGVAFGIALELLAVLVTTPAIESLFGSSLDLSDFQELVGNPLLLLVYLALNWTLAAFGEEIAFRGYLMSRGAELLGGSRGAWLVALGASSVYFGIGHGYQGSVGLVQEALSGFWLGLLFLRTRNLTVPIVAHGVSNSLALGLIYLGRYPGIS